MELYLDQFGSLLSGPDSVGDVVVKLNPSRGAGLRSVSLLDLDDDGATIDPVLPTPTAAAQPSPALAKDVVEVASTVIATPSVQPSGVLESAVNEGACAIATEARKDPVGAEETLMGEDARDDGQYRFNKLGGVLLSRPLDFQGPDIDPYLPWVCEVDVATMMAELSHEIEVGSAKVPVPSRGTSSSVEEQRLEGEFFDVKGILAFSGGLRVIELLTAMV